MIKLTDNKEERIHDVSNHLKSQNISEIGLEIINDISDCKIVFLTRSPAFEYKSKAYNSFTMQYFPDFKESINNGLKENKLFVLYKIEYNFVGHLIIRGCFIDYDGDYLSEIREEVINNIID